MRSTFTFFISISKWIEVPKIKQAETIYFLI